MAMAALVVSLGVTVVKSTATGYSFALPLMLIGLAVVVWAIVDVARRPSESLPSNSKTWWILGLVLGTLLLGPIGLIVAVAYLVGVKPKLNRRHSH